MKFPPAIKMKLPPAIKKFWESLGKDGKLSKTVFAAAALIFLQTAFWVYLGGTVFLAGIFVGRIGKNLFAVRSADAGSRLVLLIVGVFILAICAAAIVAGIGVVRRRRWARVTAIAMFALFGVFLLLGIIAAISGNRDALDPLNMLLLAADAAIVVLLLVPSTNRDFKSKEVAEPDPSLPADP